MKKTTSIICIAILIFLPSVVKPQESSQPWPIGQRIDLSGGFGDFREQRFHTGVDIRTGGRTGWLLKSPVDGYVWRVRAAYDGYGKAVYIMGDDGHIYTYAHLSRFASQIDTYVKQEQVRRQRYKVDLHPPEDSLRVKAGQQVGNSGQTGTGAPHLHFEKRTADNVPVNPLSHGFTIADQTRPTFTRIGLVQTDTSSLFANGKRTIYLDVEPDSDQLSRHRNVPYLSAPFGVLADCFDQMRPTGMKQAVYKLRAYIDDSLYYTVQLDSLPFDDGPQVNLEYDYLEAVKDRNSVRRLYQLPSNRFSGSRAAGYDSGIIGHRLSTGLHTVRIEAEDAFGNISAAELDFAWGPDEPILVADTVWKASKTKVIAEFTRSRAFDSLGITASWVEMERRSRWSRVDSLVMTELPENRLRVEVEAKRLPSSPIRMVYKAAGGCEIRDWPYNGVGTRSYQKGDLEYELVPDGIIVTYTSDGGRGLKTYVQIRNEGEYLGTAEATRFFNSDSYHMFIPVRTEYRHIDEFWLFNWSDTTRRTTIRQAANIYLVGEEANEVVEIGMMKLVFDSSQFFSPIYIEAQHHKILNRFGNLNSDHFRIEPPAFVTRADFTMHLTLEQRVQTPLKTGLCWLDEDEDRWIWLADSESAADTITLQANSRGGGSFAGVVDIDPPRLAGFSIQQNAIVTQSRPLIQFSIVDEMSGIEDDRSIQIKLDGKWMIPEFDPESTACVTRPLEDLEVGGHHLAIIVTDRAGNVVEHYRTFTVELRDSQ